MPLALVDIMSDQEVHLDFIPMNEFSKQLFLLYLKAQRVKCLFWLLHAAPYNALFFISACICMGHRAKL